jgi:hypothetical protein
MLAAMTPSSSLLHAISGLTAPRPAAPQTAAAPRPAPDAPAAVSVSRDAGAMPAAFDPVAPRGRYLDIVA